MELRMTSQANKTSSEPTASVARPRFSAVLGTPAAASEAAQRHFAGKLAFETDVADLMADLGKGHPDVMVIDTRSPESFELCRIPGAINLPRIDAATTAGLARDKVYVVYCWGPACNGSTKGALRLAELGFRVKELQGGLEYWRKEGGAVEGRLGDEAPMYWRQG
jgi:rhodanese-related sulfurtransferase